MTHVLVVNEKVHQERKQRDVADKAVEQITEITADVFASLEETEHPTKLRIAKGKLRDHLLRMMHITCDCHSHHSHE